MAAAKSKVYTEKDAKAQADSSPNVVSLPVQAALILLARAARGLGVFTKVQQSVDDGTGVNWSVEDGPNGEVMLSRESGVREAAEAATRLREAEGRLADAARRVEQLKRCIADAEAEEKPTASIEELLAAAEAEAKDRAKDVAALQKASIAPECVRTMFPHCLDGVTIRLSWEDIKPENGETVPAEEAEEQPEG